MYNIAKDGRYYMLKINDKKRVIEEFKEGMSENAFHIIANISDKVIDYNQRHFDIVNEIDLSFDLQQKYESKITPSLLLLSTIQARMKQQFSISEVPLALTSKEVINSLNVNLSYDLKESILKEANIRALLSKNETSQLEFNNYFINYFNKFTNTYLNKAGISSNIHILDCSILDVNINNSNYEGSTVTVKGGERLRGYKLGMLRGVTPNGGVIEEIIMDTAKVNDFKMTSEFILNTSYLKEGDYLLEDRGFIDLETIVSLNEKGINVVIPLKKSMDIYAAAIEEAKENGEWINHPNPRRKGQSIALVKNLESIWINEKDKLKKAENLKLNYKLNCCVIRFEKAKNKDVLTDEEIVSGDDKYAYACIVTNDTKLSCGEIIGLYEMRPEIEEDFRQLKDFWGLNTYKSTKYNIISFIIMASLIGYNFYRVYVESEEGKKYAGKSLIVEEKHGLYITKEVRTAIVSKHYFGIFEIDELLDIYADLGKEKRALLKQYLTV